MTKTTEHNNTKETKPDISKIHQSMVENKLASKTEEGATNREIKSKKTCENDHQ